MSKSANRNYFESPSSTRNNRSTADRWWDDVCWSKFKKWGNDWWTKLRPIPFKSTIHYDQIIRKPSLVLSHWPTGWSKKSKNPASTEIFGCKQLVVSPTHAHGGTLGLLMTDGPDLVRVAVVAAIGNSDHSSLSALISMAQAVPNLRVNKKCFM